MYYVHDTVYIATILVQDQMINFVTHHRKVESVRFSLDFDFFCLKLICISLCISLSIYLSSPTITNGAILNSKKLIKRTN